MEELHTYRDMVAPFVCDTSAYLWNALKEGKKILLEGQLGSLKDPDHGIYLGRIFFPPLWLLTAPSVQDFRLMRSNGSLPL